MYKYFMFSDIHGCATELINALDEAGFDIFNPNHIIIGVGDYFDRGSENLEVYNFLKAIPVERKHLVLGNHDNMLIEFLMGKDSFFNAQYNGLDRTIADLAAVDMGQWEVLRNLESLRYKVLNNHPQLLEFLESFRIGFKLDEYVIVHAGFSPENHIRMYDKGEVPVFYPDYWANTPEFIRQTRKLFENVKFVFGHWHAMKLNGDFNQIKDEESNIFYYRNYIGIDPLSNRTGRVNIFTVESGGKPVEFGSKHSLEDIIKM